jgi:hypothetical protein
MAKPWEELHTQISTAEEYDKSIAYKGLTCTARPPSVGGPRSFPALTVGACVLCAQVWRFTPGGVDHPRPLCPR